MFALLHAVLANAEQTDYSYLFLSLLKIMAKVPTNK